MQSSDGVGFVWGIVSKIRERFRTTCLGTRGFASLSLARALLFRINEPSHRCLASAAIASARRIAAPLRARASARRTMPAARSRPFPRRARPPSPACSASRNPRRRRWTLCGNPTRRHDVTRTSSRAVPRRPTRSPESWSTTSQRRSSSPTPPTPVRPRTRTPRDPFHVTRCRLSNVPRHVRHFAKISLFRAGHARCESARPRRPVPPRPPLLPDRA